jgi:hypothetical protein
LDGTGPTGEYIRTGLNYTKWRDNFAKGVEHARHPRQMRIDFTLTLPGLFEVVNIERLAKEFGVEILAKVVFAFSPDILLSPLALPRELLHSKLDSIIPNLTNSALRDVLLQLKNRPTFEEQWPDTYRAGLAKGKRRVLQLEEIRGDTYTLADILAEDTKILEWYNEIT